MKINLVLPFFPKKPGGGSKVIYEYAKQLSNRGHDVVVYHCMKLPYVLNATIPDTKIYLKYLLRKLKLQQSRRPKWFALPNKVKCRLIPYINNGYLRDADIIISTWWEVAAMTSKLSLNKGKRINLIQGYEDWSGFKDLLHESYNIQGNTNVVISSSLYDIVTSFTHNKVYLIPNSVDPEQFYVKKPVDNRKQTSISFMYSQLIWKGSVYGLRALELLKQQYPDLSVFVFGIRSRPDDLPEWMDYFQNPSDLPSLYNSSSIFLSSSIQEGWGLTPMEAMACGCACVATKIDGHLEYMTDEVNALLVPVEDVEAIVDKISNLIENDSIRLNLVSEGLKTIDKFSWNTSTDKLETILYDLNNNSSNKE